MTSYNRALAPILVLAVAGIIGCAGDPAPPSTDGELAPVPAHGQVELTWSHDWDVALARAAAEERPVLVDFSAEWCIWCRRLESTTFVDDEVRELLSSMVLLQLEIDRGGRQRAAKLGVQAPPTLVVLAPDGRELGRILGYMPPGAFHERLSQLLSSG